MAGLGFARKDLALALDDLGIGEGDLVYVQVCAEPGAGEDIDQACANIYGALRDAIGREGTILAPSYTFSFCRRQVFDPAETPTEGGPYNSFAAFPEFLRRLPGATRSEDPIFSVAGIGPVAQALLSKLPHECFGVDSVFDRVRRADGKFVLVGVGLYEAVFRHFVESRMRVPWRYDKQFAGTIRTGSGAPRRETWLYNVRLFAPNADPAGEAIEALALAEGIGAERRFGDTFVQTARAGALYELCVRELTIDPWCSAIGPAGDPIEIERRRVNAPRVAPSLPTDASMAEAADVLRPLARTFVSADVDAALATLATRVPLEIERWLTGARSGEWVIPEEWNCREAHVETLDGRRVLTAREGVRPRPHSRAFDGVVDRDELMERLFSGDPPGETNWIDREWGFHCAPEQRAALTMPRYRVVINSTFSYGALAIGALHIPGDSKDTFVLSAHVSRSCPDAEAINGAVVAVEAARALMGRPRRRYSYLLLLSPEPVGSAPYLERRPQLANVLRGGLLIGAVGNEGPPKLTLSGNAKLDAHCERAARQEEPGASAETGPSAQSEAKTFRALGVPFLTLSRSGAAASPTAIGDQLELSRRIVLRFIDAIEADA